MLKDLKMMRIKIYFFYIFKLNDLSFNNLENYILKLNTFLRRIKMNQ